MLNYRYQLIYYYSVCEKPHDDGAVADVRDHTSESILRSNRSPELHHWPCIDTFCFQPRRMLGNGPAGAFYDQGYPQSLFFYSLSFPCSPVLTGKSALRFYPYHGHLGYSPVTVQGVVRTVLDDAKNLPASSITIAVRCIESRIGLRSNESRVLADYSKVLWSKPDDQEFADVSALELPFRLTIPTDSPGFSTSLFVEYRCIWRIQAGKHSVLFIHPAHPAYSIHL